VAVLGVSGVLLANEQLLQRIGGAVTIVMGLVFLGWFRPVQRSVKLPHQPRAGLWGAPLLGATYGLGWTPCLGPTLAGVIALASGTQVGGTT
jgi:cytochrome c-type biogenesis protein